MSRTLSKAELIMHPIRFRILIALSDRCLSTKQVAHSLSDISQASVYRHMHILWKAGVLKLVEEVPVRGVIERFFAFSHEDTMLSHEETEQATADDYLRYFHVFVNSLLSQYRLYLQSGETNPRLDGVAHWNEAVYLTPAERHQMVTELRDSTLKRMSNTPTPDRTRYIVGRIIIPDKTNSEAFEDDEK